MANNTEFDRMEPFMTSATEDNGGISTHFKLDSDLLLTPAEEHIARLAEVLAANHFLRPEVVGVLVSPDYKAVLEARLRKLLEPRGKTRN